MGEFGGASSGTKSILGSITDFAKPSGNVFFGRCPALQTRIRLSRPAAGAFGTPLGTVAGSTTAHDIFSTVFAAFVERNNVVDAEKVRSPAVVTPPSNHDEFDICKGENPRRSVFPGSLIGIFNPIIVRSPCRSFLMMQLAIPPLVILQRLRVFVRHVLLSIFASVLWPLSWHVDGAFRGSCQRRSRARLFDQLRQRLQRLYPYRLALSNPLF